MCGIAGFMNADVGEESARNAVMPMIAELHHRGPDDTGSWACDGLALAQSRLAIIDLSEAGRQPMSSDDGRYVIVFNGEIYNHQLLRNELDCKGLARNWRGHSDTETFLAVLSEYDISTALTKCIGMFAFALWDKREKTLTLGRDRMGEKPLYFGWQGKTLLFGSELKALRAHPDFNAAIDRNALQKYMRLSYVPAPDTIFQGIKKLVPGTYVTIPVDSTPGVLPPAGIYWSVETAASQTVNEGISDTEALAELESLLGDAVRQQMVADVPLGAFLSGGFDSSLITSLMQADSTSAIKTFTIGFHEGQYNEAEHAKSVAAHLGTDHTELYVDAKQTLDVVPHLARLYDEPFADSSQIPTYLVSKLARQHVTVSLSGDAGDELFGGYNRYFWATKMWKSFGGFPLAIKRAVASAIQCLPPEKWDTVFASLASVTPASFRFKTPGDKLHKLAGLLSSASQDDLYNRLISQWPPSVDVVLGNHNQDSFSTENRDLSSFQVQMMLDDQMGYLPGDILTKVDRAAMGVSLETRVPMLDHRVVEFSWRMPIDKKIRDGRGKWLLRQLLYKHVPQELVDRPKMGFAVPIDAWLRGPLREWAESLLSENRLAGEGYLSTETVRSCWQEHLTGKRNWSYRLWNVLMFQAWLDEYG